MEKKISLILLALGLMCGEASAIEPKWFQDEKTKCPTPPKPNMGGCCIYAKNEEKADLLKQIFVGPSEATWLADNLKGWCKKEMDKLDNPNAEYFGVQVCYGGNDSTGCTKWDWWFGESEAAAKKQP